MYPQHLHDFNLKLKDHPLETSHHLAWCLTSNVYFYITFYIKKKTPLGISDYMTYSQPLQSKINFLTELRGGFDLLREYSISPALKG